MINPKSQCAQRTPPGWLIKRYAAGHFSTSCTWLSSAIIGFRRSSNPRRFCGRRLAPGANRNDSSCSRPCSRHNPFLQRKPSFRATACNFLQLLVEDRFPQIWVPSWENRDLRQLLWRRHRMVQARTRIMNPSGKYQPTWAFVLEQLQPDQTRLIVRGRVAPGYRPYGLPQWLALPLAALHTSSCSVSSSLASPAAPKRMTTVETVAWQRGNAAESIGFERSKTSVSQPKGSLHTYPLPLHPIPKNKTWPFTQKS
jgi:hypothetical protein